MSLEFSKAKNQSITCKYNNQFLHSSYNPEAEAKRFVESITVDYIPSNIIIMEPALAYCVPYLKEKFPDAKIFAIRFLREFENPKIFIKEFYFSKENNLQELLEKNLFDYFGESQLLNSLFISWPPSQKLFFEEDTIVWKIIKKLLTDCQNILATRQYFAKRWIKNQINFFLRINSTSNICKTDFPILVCASGMSLKNSIPFIKKIQNRFFIIACSSCIKALLENQIIPDLCISTDGGYWAKKHLECLINFNQNIKLAISPESNIPTELFNKKNIQIIPLSYGDNFDNEIFDNLKIPYTKAKRNGTISGTAVELALSLTTEKVFMCGIDLETTNGFVHTQPNELEIINSTKDFKLNSLEKRTFSSNRNSLQLELYRDWFINYSLTFNQRLFRISDNYNFNNSLGKIKEINFTNLQTFNFLKTKMSELFFEKGKKINILKSNVSNIFLNLLNNSVWVENYFPADCLMIKRSKQNSQIKNYKKLLDEKLSLIECYINKMVK